MAHIDQKILFTALGFLAVIMNDTPNDKQALRAASIASLIESFCMSAVPEAFAKENSAKDSASNTKQLLDNYIAELRNNGSARLDHDRKTLLDMYEMLMSQKIRHDQREFFATGHENVIANRILQLAEEQIQQESQS